MPNQLISQFDLDELIKNKNLITNEVNNISLFGKKKIIFIDQVNDKFLDTIKEILSIVGENKIIFFSEILDKRSKVRGFFEKDENLRDMDLLRQHEASQLDCESLRREDEYLEEDLVHASFYNARNWPIPH